MTTKRDQRNKTHRMVGGTMEGNRNPARSFEYGDSIRATWYFQTQTLATALSIGG